MTTPEQNLNNAALNLVDVTDSEALDALHKAAYQWVIHQLQKQVTVEYGENDTDEPGNPFRPYGSFNYENLR